MTSCSIGACMHTADAAVVTTTTIGGEWASTLTRHVCPLHAEMYTRIRRAEDRVLVLAVDAFDPLSDTPNETRLAALKAAVVRLYGLRTNGGPEEDPAGKGDS